MKNSRFSPHDPLHGADHELCSREKRVFVNPAAFATRRGLAGHDGQYSEDRGHETEQNGAFTSCRSAGVTKEKNMRVVSTVVLIMAFAGGTALAQNPPAGSDSNSPAASPDRAPVPVDPLTHPTNSAARSNRSNHHNDWGRACI